MSRQVVRLIVLNTKDQVLLCQSALSGSIKLPGGGMEDGETAEQTAVRELREETSLKITEGDLKFLGEVAEIISQDNPDIVHDLRPGDVQQAKYYQVKVTSEPKPANVKEISGCEWIDQDKVVDKLTYITQKEAFSKLVLGKEFVAPKQYTSEV